VLEGTVHVSATEGRVVFADLVGRELRVVSSGPLPHIAHSSR